MHPLIKTPCSTFASIQTCIANSTLKANLQSSHHDQWEPVDLAAIHNEIASRTASFEALFATLVTTPNKATEHSSKTKITNSPKPAMKMTIIVTTTQLSSLTKINVVAWTEYWVRYSLDQAKYMKIPVTLCMTSLCNPVLSSEVIGKCT